MPAMEREQIRSFLYRVATNPAYREQLENDPVGTLAQVGITINETDVPREGSNISLPTNEEILAKLEAMTDVLSPMLCLRFFRFFRIEQQPQQQQ
jgi:hypothetical protein